MTARDPYPPYKASPIGGARTKPFTRPSGDSLPVIECETPGCGGRRALTGASEMVLTYKGLNHWFCSLGCLGRWAARMELRA